jgi:hypothetical protein
MGVDNLVNGECTNLDRMCSATNRRRFAQDRSVHS